MDHNIFGEYKKSNIVRKNIKMKIKSAEDLRIYLNQLHPDKEIAVVIGTDNFSMEDYFSAAFFSYDEARDYVSSIKPNGTGSLSDSHSIQLCTIDELERQTKRVLEDLNKDMLYKSLFEKIDRIDLNRF